MKKITLLTLLMLGTTALFAQTPFNGSWKFKDQASVSGNLYANGSPSSVTINSSGDDLKMDYIDSDGQNDVPSSESFSGGKPYETKTQMGRKKVITLSWSADKGSFTETSNIYSLTDAGKLDFKNTDTWTIENGNLVLDRKNENNTNGETWESKATYEKQ